MSKLAVITGGGSGIGQALAWRLAERDIQVVIVGRSAEKLRETQQQAAEKIDCIVADIADNVGRDSVVKKLLQIKIDYLIHNAGILGPITALENLRLEQWREVQAINVEAPLFLTQALLPQLAGARILHISSGAAHHPIAGCMPYCVSKAALYMIYQCLRDELAVRNILIGSVRPGKVETAMQQLLRSDANPFASREIFHQAKERGQVSSPQQAAKFIAWLLLETDGTAFVSQEWDAR